MKSLLFIVDPLRTLKPNKDSTIAMMRELALRGYTLFCCEVGEIRWLRGYPVMAQAVAVNLTGRSDVAWFRTTAMSTPMLLCDFDAVLMRKDPPFDSEYFYATHLLDQAEREGARVFNRGQALRDHPEKLSLLEFAAYTAPTLVTRNIRDILPFHAEHRDIILKPLDGMGGMGIYRVREDGLNLGSIVESLTRNGARTIMVQRYLPEIVAGDKRVLLIDGEPVPYCLARIPQGGEVRGNLAAGGKGVARPLSDGDFRIARAVGPILAARGLFLVGLDIIGETVTEINVTSPTCFQEITEQSGFNVAQRFSQALEAALRRRSP